MNIFQGTLQYYHSKWKKWNKWIKEMFKVSEQNIQVTIWYHKNY